MSIVWNQILQKIYNAALNGIQVVALPVGSDGIFPVKFGDTANVDAFDRLRVSTPQTIFECNWYQDISILFDTAFTGSGNGSWDSQRSSYVLTTGTASGDSAILQTRRYFTYHPGKSQLPIFTGILGPPVANCRKRHGQFDAANGYFHQLDGLVPGVGLRSSVSGSVVDTIVTQSNWNMDKLDGTGPSGFVLNPSFQEIFIIDYQWLGSGRVRYGFDINGMLIYCHEIFNANVITSPYSQTAQLPMRLEITNTGNTLVGGSIKQTCITVISEGGYNPEGIGRTASSGVTHKTMLAGTRTPILSIRKQSAFNKIPIKISEINYFIDTTDIHLVTVSINSTLTGASFTNVAGIGQIDVSASAISGGTDVYSTYLKGSTQASSQLSIQDLFELSNVILGTSIAGVSDIITISSINVSSGASSALAAFNYREML